MECPVCLSPYEAEVHRPLVLNCGHKLCSICLPKLQNSESPGKCPKCRHAIPEPGWQAPVDFDLLQMIDEVNSENAPMSSCDMHPRSSSIGLCSCGFNVCSECWTTHSQKHTLCGTGSGRKADSLTRACLIHKESLKYYCISHECLVCRDCRDFGTHSKCKVDLSQNVLKLRKAAFDVFSRRVAKRMTDSKRTRTKICSSVLKDAEFLKEGADFLHNQLKYFIKSRHDGDQRIDRLLSSIEDDAQDIYLYDAEHVANTVAEIVAIEAKLDKAVDDIHNSHDSVVDQVYQRFDRSCPNKVDDLEHFQSVEGIEQYEFRISKLQGIVSAGGIKRFSALAELTRVQEDKIKLLEKRLYKTGV